jgi:hypothetical protein
MATLAVATICGGWHAVAAAAGYSSVECLEEEEVGKTVTATEGNRFCASDEEVVELNGLKSGSWKTIGCGVRLPVSWTSVKGNTEHGEVKFTGIPGFGSLFAGSDFHFEVYAESPDGNWDVDEEDGASEVAESEDGSQAEEGWSEEKSGARVIIQHLTQHININVNDNGDEKWEVNTLGPPKESSVQIDHENGRWISGFSYNAYFLKRRPLSTVFVCSAEDELSLDAFSGLCTIIIERMTLNPTKRRIGECDD